MPASRPALVTRMLGRVSRAVLCVLIAFGAAIPATAGESVEALLTEFQKHGYASPKRAAERLLTATDLPIGGSPLPLRQDYYATLVQILLMYRDTERAEQAVGELQRMANSAGCVSCQFRWQLRRAQVDHVLGRKLRGEQGMAEAAALLPPDDPLMQLELWAVQAVVSAHLGDLERATEIGLKAADLAARLGRYATQVDMLMTVMDANVQRGDMDRALVDSEEVLHIAQRIKYGYAIALLRGNQGYLYGQKKDFERLRAAMVEALEYAEGVPGLEDFLLTTLINLSAVHIHQGQPAQAIPYAERAEAVARKIGGEMSLAFAISNRGSAMARMGRVNAGLALMNEASVIAKDSPDRRATIDLLNDKVNVLELVGRHAQALATLREVVALTEQITTSERKEAIVELQEKFASERKTREISRLSSENARREAEVRVRTWQQRLWAAVAVALALGSVLLVQGLKRLRHRNRTLEVHNATLSEQSLHDPLTGVFNRRHFEVLMQEHSTRLQGRSRDRDYQACVSLIALDIDLFKQINDTHGHSVGDVVLVEIAVRLQELLREKDAVIRWGGEEFVLLLPGTPPDGLLVVAERLLQAIGGRPVNASGIAVPVTASAGCVTWPAYPGQHWQDALHIADLALYRAKATGRNRAVSINTVMPTADVERLRQDLRAAEQAGDVELRFIEGPAQTGRPAAIV